MKNEEWTLNIVGGYVLTGIDLLISKDNDFFELSDETGEITYVNKTAILFIKPPYKKEIQGNDAI